MSVSAATVRDVARRWWRRHVFTDGEPRPGPRPDPRTRELLRRTRTTQDAMAIPAALDLARGLGVAERGADADDLARAIDLARVLACIRRDEREHPMRKVGYPSFPTPGSDGAQPKLSELRFRRLLQTDAGASVAAFARLLAQMGDEANVADIAEAFWFWNRSSGYVKQRWAFKYFNADGVIPPSLIEDDPHSTEETAPQ